MLFKSSQSEDIVLWCSGKLGRVRLSWLLKKIQEPRVLSRWCARGCRCDDNDSVSELTEADGLVCWRKAEEAEALWDLLAPSCFPSTPGTVPVLWYSAMAELGMISRLISDCF